MYAIDDENDDINDDKLKTMEEFNIEIEKLILNVYEYDDDEDMMLYFLEKKVLYGENYFDEIVKSLLINYSIQTDIEEFELFIKNKQKAYPYVFMMAVEYGRNYVAFKEVIEKELIVLRQYYFIYVCIYIKEIIEHRTVVLLK